MAPKAVLLPSAVIQGLQAILRAKQDELEGLRGRNQALRVRLAVLAVAQRCLEEAVAHKRAHGGDAAAEAAQLEALRAAAHAAGGGAPLPPPLPIPMPHLAPGVSLLGLDSMTAEEVATVRGRAHAATATFVDSLMAEGHWLIQELHPPAAPADEARRLGLPGWPGAGSAATAAAQQAASEARRRLAAVGAAVRCTYMLLNVWAPDSYVQLFGNHHQTGCSVLGAQGPSTDVYDVAVRRAGFCRELALLGLESASMTGHRVSKLGAQRALISAALAALDTARTEGGGGGGAGPSNGGASGGSGGSSGSGSGGGGPSGGGSGGGGSACPQAPTAASIGAKPCSPGAGRGPLADGPFYCPAPGGAAADPYDYTGWTLEELVHELAINTACVKEVIRLHSMVELTLLNDEQLIILMSAAYPHPVAGKSVVESVRHLLVLDAAASLPWAGAPWDAARP